MRKLFLNIVTLAVFLSCSAQAEDAIPDLKGVWTGTARALVYGHGHHHPGGQSITLRTASNREVFGGVHLQALLIHPH